MPRRSERRWPAIAAAIILLGLGGCRRGPTVVPVSGVVEVDGKPLTSGAIMVIPAEGRPASGTISADGRFTLTTFTPGDGVLTGTHQVVVTAHESLGGLKIRWLVPTECRSMASSPLRLVVTGRMTDAKVSMSTDGKPLPIEDMGTTSGDISPQGVVQP